MTRHLSGRVAGRFALATVLFVSAGWIVVRGVEEQGTPAGWFKGNTHTHTLNSDGDSTPDDVVRWYREHGYQFLVLTDHNFLTSVDALNALHGASDRFLVIRGEEVTDRFGDKPIHVNGLAVAEHVAPQGGSSVVEVIQRNVNAIRGAKGVPHVNHPNFGWAITADELRQVENNPLIEIFNGHPLVNNLGGGGVPGLEQVWDILLTSGRQVYGIAVDDAHTFKDPGNPAVAGPGRGWVMVRAPRLEARALVDALERGDFYATTGVVLADYQVTSREITVRVRPTSSSKYRIQFIGSGGRLLRESVETQATYVFTGDEGYVRAKILESNGLVAWCQPVRVVKKYIEFEMSALRTWFGPSREEVWRELSSQIGASYVDGGFWKGDKVQARHGEWTITLDTYTVHANNAHVHYTRLRAPYVNPGGFRFAIYRRSVFTGLGTFFGMQDVEVGHEGFDHDFVIKGTSDAQLRELFSSARLRELLAQQPAAKLEVRDDEGWFGPSFPDGVDELRFTVRGVVKDLDRLKEMYELFAEALDQLCGIGAAYENAPGVQL